MPLSVLALEEHKGDVCALKEVSQGKPSRAGPHDADYRTRIVHELPRRAEFALLTCNGCDSTRHAIARPALGVRVRVTVHAANNFSFGTLSTNVCIGVLP